jgi:hypothetical protein
MSTTTHPNRPPAYLSLGQFLDRAVVMRSAIIAAVIGTVLTAINQYGAVRGAVSLQWLPFSLVFLTPFLVVTFSQLAAIRRAAADARVQKNLRPSETFLETLNRHGIWRRTFTIGFIAGTINTAIILAQSLLDTSPPTTDPGILIAQVYALPVIFGLLSQTISYRRALRKLEDRGRNPSFAMETTS